MVIGPSTLHYLWCYSVRLDTAVAPGIKMQKPEVMDSAVCAHACVCARVGAFIQSTIPLHYWVQLEWQYLGCTHSLGCINRDTLLAEGWPNYVAPQCRP